MIFFSDDEDKTNYAHCLNSPAEIPKPDERAEKLKKNIERKEDKSEKIEIALLDERLRNIRKRLRDEKKKSAKESLQANVQGVMELEEAARELKSEIAEKWKGDKAMLRRMNAAVDKCFQDQMAGD